MDRTSLEAALSRSSVRLSEVADALASPSSRVDLIGARGGSLELVLDEIRRGTKRPQIIVTADADTARRVAASLRFFLAERDDAEEAGRVLTFPVPDNSPFVDVAPDRRAAMERLSALFHVAHGLPWSYFVVAAPALLRRVPPKRALVARSSVVRTEGELDRDTFLRVLAEGGYLKVPVVEDPGTFAVRGSIVDVYPPHARYPARIELDDYLVMSIKLFDPDDQRSVRGLSELYVHPVRESLLGKEELTRAKERVRELCDAVNVPTSRVRQMLEDLEEGRAFIGLEGLLPAFYESLDSVLDYFPKDVLRVVHDPVSVDTAVQEDLERAQRDHDARVESGAPSYPLSAHYIEMDELANWLQNKPILVSHPLVQLGSPLPGIAALATPESEPIDLGAEDNSPLVAELKAQRGSQGKHDALAPLARRARAWLDDGYRVLFSARVTTQAERLSALLRGYDVPVLGTPQRFDPDVHLKSAAGTAHVVMGPLTDGFVLASSALVVVTDEEIFGARAARRVQARKEKKKSDAFIEDLRQLAIGDFVVHVDHGIGKYLGIQRKSVPLSKYEEMQGMKPVVVEVLIVEYGGGDKLFLPVSRLNQIQKFKGGEGASPKLDKLGGTTFAKTKQRVAQEVKKLADELLRIFAQRAASTREPLNSADRTYQEFEATFPFEETPDQLRAIEEVLTDLEQPRPMDRLVCGDVGFGKTEVALRAAFRVASQNRQVAVLCPTTVLAQQHANTFRNRLREWPFRVEVLSRFETKKEQSETLAAVKEGKVDILVGTHRLLSKDVHFKKLGMLVVDEEQRFGVTHKERIKQLRSEVDVLTLSATPIPRTLQMAVSGLRDLSLITTAPTDRRAVRTLLVRWEDHLIKEAINRELTRGGQAFFVYNRIEGLYERARRVQELVPEARVAVAHGQMNEAALEQVMTDFVDGRYDVLCATAIIESGLDIPRANTILIDRADTFGLAQLYQLRGRVGRSKERAYCYLIAPPQTQLTDDARYRLEALGRFTELGSGFQVATLDMELRGAGDILGAEQSGSVAMVGLDLFVRMLDEAVARLRGEVVVHEVDTELTLMVEHHIPDTYVDDVGVRLSLYKRLASASDEQEVADIAAEMEDRFGPAPDSARRFVRAMSQKPALRELRALGCEATAERVTLHLRADTPLDAAKIAQKAALPRSPWKLTPDMKLVRRFEAQPGKDAIDRIEELLRELDGMRQAGK